MKKPLLTPIVLFSLMPFTLCAAQPPKTKVKVVAQCSGSTGSTFVFHFREAIRRSAAYTLDDAGTFVVTVLCADDQAGSGLSAVSLFATIPYGGSLSNCPPTGIVSQQVFLVGSARAEAMATSALAGIDEDLHH